MNLRHKAVAAVTAGLMITAPLTPLTALADKQSDLAAAASQLASLGEELSSLEGQLDQASADLEQTKYEIDNKTQQITETQEDLDEAKATLSGRTLSFNGINDGMFEIVSLQGQVVKTATVSSTMDLSSLDAGVYMLRVAGKSVKFSQKIVLE